MNGFVFHVNNNLENQFSTKKTPSIAAKPYFFQMWHAVLHYFKT